MITPEYDLARAVIYRAIEDLFLVGDDVQQSNTLSWKEKVYAIQFLTDATGKWAREREMWCSLIDRDPDELRKGVVDLLEGSTELANIYDDRKGDMTAGLEQSRKHYADLHQGPTDEWRAAAERRKRDRAILDARKVNKPKQRPSDRASVNARRALIVDALRDHGPMTISELIHYLDGEVSTYTIYRLAETGVLGKDGIKFILPDAA